MPIVALLARICDTLIRRWARYSRYDARVTGGVTNASEDLVAALTRARQLVAHPDNDQPAMINGATVPDSKPPWNTAVANTVYGVTEAARRLETLTRQQVTGTVSRRGGSDANTDDAIRALDALTAAVDRNQAAEINRTLSGWTTSLLRLRAIDEAVIWLPIRSQTLCGECGTRLDDGVCPVDGWRARPPRCPYCQTMHLRRADRAFVVMCHYTDCPGDSDGNRPAFARLEMSNVPPYRAILAWSDGLVEGGDT